MTTRTNVLLIGAMQELGELKVARELEDVLQRPFCDQRDHYLFSMGLHISSALEYVKEVAESRGNDRVHAYAQFCSAVAVAGSYYDPARIIPDAHLFERTAVALLLFFLKFVPKKGEHEDVSLTRLGIVCDQRTGALALMVQGHLNRLLGVLKEDTTS